MCVRSQYCEAFFYFSNEEGFLVYVSLKNDISIYGLIESEIISKLSASLYTSTCLQLGDGRVIYCALAVEAQPKLISHRFWISYSVFIIYQGKSFNLSHYLESELF